MNLYQLLPQIGRRLRIQNLKLDTEHCYFVNSLGIFRRQHLSTVSDPFSEGHRTDWPMDFITDPDWELYPDHSVVSIPKHEENQILKSFPKESHVREIIDSLNLEYELSQREARIAALMPVSNSRTLTDFSEQLLSGIPISHPLLRDPVKIDSKGNFLLYYMVDGEHVATQELKLTLPLILSDKWYLWTGK